MKSKEFNKVKPYTYFIKRKSDNMKYHGVRWANKVAPLSDFSFIPLTIFGVFLKVHSLLPGSIRSGEYPSKKSSPATKFEFFSSIGFTISNVVPG